MNETLLSSLFADDCALFFNSRADLVTSTSYLNSHLSKFGLMMEHVGSCDVLSKTEAIGSCISTAPRGPRKNKDTDSFLSSALTTILNVDFTKPPASEMLQLNFNADEVAPRARHFGLGWRPLTKRFLALSSLNNAMPQAIDRRTNAGLIVSSLWNSLGDVLGAGSLDDDKKGNRWSFFFESRCSFGQDFKTLTERIKKRYTDSLERIGKAPAADCVISAATSGFGFGVRKLHKSAQDVLRHLDYEGLLKDAGTLTKDDQRGLAFLSTHDNSFADAFPLAVTGSDPNDAFSPREFQVAIKLGVPIDILLPYVNSTVRANENSYRTTVDPYGNGVASATGVP